MCLPRSVHCQVNNLSEEIHSCVRFRLTCCTKISAFYYSYIWEFRSRSSVFVQRFLVCVRKNQNPSFKKNVTFGLNEKELSEILEIYRPIIVLNLLKSRKTDWAARNIYLIHIRLIKIRSEVLLQQCSAGTRILYKNRPVIFVHWP